MSDARLAPVRSVVARYVRGENTETELRQEVRDDPELGALAATCLGCAGIAQELLEALDRSPFDADPQVGPIPAPTRHGLSRWLERVRDGLEEPVAFCDWATDAFAWHDPDEVMDPVVQDVLAELSADEDDVRSLVDDEAMLAVVLAHLELEPGPDAVHRLALGRTVVRHRDELLVGFATRMTGGSDDAALRASVAPIFAAHAASLPDVVDRIVERIPDLAAGGLDLDRIERFLDGLARTGDPDAAATAAERPGSDETTRPGRM